MYILRGVRESGEQVFYTGRAGQAFVSAHSEDAFCYETREGAGNKATSLNRGSSLTGIWFTAQPEVEDLGSCYERNIARVIMGS